MRIMRIKCTRTFMILGSSWKDDLCSQAPSQLCMIIPFLWIKHW